MVMPVGPVDRALSLLKTSDIVDADFEDITRKIIEQARLYRVRQGLEVCSRGSIVDTVI